MIKEFRDFVLRGNVIELAVAIVIGTAFTALVTAFVANIITPLVAALGGGSSIGLSYTLVDGNDASRLDFGAVIGALITFLITAAVVFFVFVRPMNTLAARFAPPTPTEEPAKPADVILLEEIRDLLRSQSRA